MVTLSEDKPQVTAFALELEDESKAKQSKGKWYRPTCVSLSGGSSARCPPDKCSRKRDKGSSKVAGQRAKMKELSDKK